MRRLTMQASSDAFAGEHLHLVAFEEIIPAVEGDTAFEPFADFGDVVFESPERGDAAFPDLGTLPLQANAIRSVNHAVEDDTARDDLAAGLDGLPNFGVAVDDLSVAGLEHAIQQALDLFEQGVDDAVLANRDAIRFRRAAGFGFSLDVEGDDHGLRGHGQVDVVDVHVAQPGMNDFGAGLGLIAQFFQRVDNRFNAALNVGLDDQVQLLDGSRADAGEHRFEVHLAVAVVLTSAILGLDQGACGALVDHGSEAIASRGDAGQPEDFDRKRRSGVFDSATLIVEQGFDAALGRARDDEVTHMQ